MTATPTIGRSKSMDLLSLDVTDQDVIALADRGAALMESEDCAAAYAFTEHDAHMKWTPDWMGEVVQACGDMAQ